MAEQKQKITRRKKGFERTSGLLQSRIRAASESRGFSESRLLTHWNEIVGAQMASMARPVKVSYAKGGFGATLTVLTTGAFAPMLQAELPKLRERVNAVYGYNAIARIHITQTAPTGFADGQVAFDPQPKSKKPEPSAEMTRAAHNLSRDVTDDGLRKALSRLGENILLKQANSKKVEQ